MIDNHTDKEDAAMRILALDSSGLVASAAVLEEEQTIAEYTVNYKKTHSQTLLPMVDEIARMIELDLKTLDAIAVAAGPGSFTGLRIGSATAKGLGLALDIPLIHIPTLEGLAYNMYGVSELVCPLMDARRKQVYTGIYSFEGGFSTVMDQCAIPVSELADRLNELGQAVILLGDGVPVYRETLEGRLSELADRLNELGQAVILLGDGVPVYRETLEGRLSVPHTYAPAHMNRQRAASVGALGMEYYRQGRTETAAQHAPDYLRVSQAERERAQREKKE